MFSHTPDDEEGAEDRTVADPTDLKFVGPSTAGVIAAAEFSARDVADKDVSYRMLVEAGVNPGVAAKIRRYHSLQWSFETGDDLDRRSEQIRGLQDAERAWVASSYGDDDETDETATDASASDSAGSDAAGDGEGSSAATDDEAAWAASAGVADDEASEDAGTADQFAAEASWVADSSLSDAGASADGSGDPVDAEAAWRDRSKPTPLTEVTGIGEAHAATLSEAGVTSVRSLATADPELLADVTGLPESKVADWYDRANERFD